MAKAAAGTRPGALRRARWLSELAALRALQAALVPLPHRARLALGRALGRAVFALDARHRRVALANLALAFPAASEPWRLATARRSFEHLGRLLVEIVLERRLAPSLGRRLEVEGLEHLESAAASGGYFLLSGHFGNWEWIALEQGRRGRPLVMVARPLDNAHLERWFAALRSATGNRVVYKRNAVREMVKALKASEGIAFMVDQYFPGDGAHLVPYFGVPAATTPALGTLAARLGVPVVPVFAYAEDDGRYRVVYEPPIRPVAGADPDAEARRISAEATARLEAAVRRRPDTWFWMHRRWR